MALLATSTGQTPYTTVLLPLQIGNLIFQSNHLRSGILKHLGHADDIQTCVFEFVKLVVDTYVGSIEFSLQAPNFGNKWCQRWIVLRAVQP
jgi:hypothetical protein